MRKTVLFAAAAFVALAASASPGGSGGPPDKVTSNTLMSSTAAAKEAYKWKLIPIDDQMAPPTESPQVAWTERVTQKYKDASVSIGKAPGLSLDPDVGWTATPISYYVLYIDQNGQSASSAQGFGEKASALRLPCPHWATVKYRPWC